jgi:hypothetical protein
MTPGKGNDMDKRGKDKNPNFETSIAPSLDEVWRAVRPGGVCCIVAGTDADAAAWRSLALQAGIRELRVIYVDHGGPEAN